MKYGKMTEGRFNLNQKAIFQVGRHKFWLQEVQGRVSLKKGHGYNWFRGYKGYMELQEE